MYIDTSVLVAYYCPEPRSAAVQERLQADPLPVISRLTEVELASAVARKVREGGLVRQDAHRILDVAARHVREGYYVVRDMAAEDWGRARVLLARMYLPLRTLDALHLVLAERMGIELYTADEKLRRSAEAVGVPVQFLE